MKAARMGFAGPSFALLRSVSLTASESATSVLMGLMLVGLAISVLAPPVGVVALEVAFPVLGVWILLQKSADRFAPTVLFPAVYLLWYWLGNIPLLVGDRTAALTTHPGDRLWFYCLLGLFAYLCGTLLIRGEVGDASGLRGAQGEWQEGPLLLFLGLLALGIFLAWASITVSEGIPVLKSEVDTFRLEIPTRHHLAYQVLISFSTLMLPLTFLYLWSARAPKLRWALYGCNVFIVFIFVSLGSRGLVLPALLTVFALRHYLRKPWPVKYILIAGLVVLPLLSVSGYYRSVQHFGPAYALGLADLGMPVQLQPFTNIYLYVRAPVETFRNVAGIIPAVRPFEHGSVSYGALLQVLPGRHPSSDYFFKELLGHAEDGFGEPASILGSFYADFGGAGIFGAMLLVGMVTKFVYLQMFRGSLGWLLAYCFLWQKLVGSLYGSLFTYITELLIPVAWIVVVWGLTSGRLPRRASVDARVETR